VLVHVLERCDYLSPKETNMRWQFAAVLFVVAVAAVLPCESWAEPDCPQDSVPSGTICIDTYEASVWKTTDALLVRKIRKGSATLQDLTSAGAIQLGLMAGDLVAAGCVSDVGAFDMVGNLSEWVADWVPLSTACPGWAQPGFPSLSDDSMCLAGANSGFGPGALFRGGDFSLGTGAGVFAINGLNNPFLDVHGALGFRAAR
ncbi:MAG TPA: hypothetical protein VJK29_05930, partial [Terriglobales bacterium]|nr:hypothetical protein [Terriglobales bacterium]